MPESVPPRADARTEAVNRTRGLLHDFQRRMVTVRGGIRRIGELLGNENLRIFLRHALRHRGALGNRIADVARIMNETDLRTVMLDQLPTLFTDAVGHDDDRLIAAHGADERKANALIAARRFDDDGIGLEASAGLGIENHVVGRPRLDRTADVQGLELHQHFRHVRRHHLTQPHQRGVSDRFQNIVANHLTLLSIAAHYTTAAA